MLPALKENVATVMKELCTKHNECTKERMPNFQGVVKNKKILNISHLQKN